MVILEKAFFSPVERSKSDYNIIHHFKKKVQPRGNSGKITQSF